jgi:hypothetical protein
MAIRAIIKTIWGSKLAPQIIRKMEVINCDLKPVRIIDNKAVYHFGASLKDLGKKWFAFSKMDIGVGEMLRKLDGIG